VDLGALDHQEKSFGGPIFQKLEGFVGGGNQVVAAQADRQGFAIGGEVTYVLFSPDVERLDVLLDEIRDLVVAGDQLGDQVAIIAPAGEVVLAAADKEIDFRVEEAQGDVFHFFPAVHMGDKGSRCGVGDGRGGDQAGGHAARFSHLEQGGDGHFLDIDADRAVEGFDPGGKGGGAGGAVGHEIVGGIGLVEADVAELLKHRLIVVHVHG